MTSDTAKAAIEEMWRNGLHPSVDDIVRLNALGLKVDRGDNADGFDALPRMAFVGDVILREPTMLKRVWMADVSRAFSNDIFTRLCFTAWALWVDDRELPPAGKVRKIGRRVAEFRDEYLALLTETEIVAAVDWCLHGATPTTDEYPELTERECRELAKVKDVPPELRDAARAVISSALRAGVPMDSALRETSEHLDSVITLSLLAKNGAEFAKSVKLQHIGEFNLTADKIVARLKKEQENGQATH